MNFKDILDDFEIDETYTKPVRKPKKFTKVKDQIPMKEDYNFMADLLSLPETKEGYKYLFVITDLANDDFDIEPIKNKDTETITEAIKKIIKRDKYISMPYASVQTDNGKEFMGAFEKFLTKNNILHKRTLPYRHTQNSNVESLNKQLGRILNGYMNRKEKETGETYKEWTDILDQVRIKLNKFRHKKLDTNREEKPFSFIKGKKLILPLFQEGDIVYRQLDYPKDALLNQQNTPNFRVGDYRFDLVPKKIEQVLYYNGDIPFRYRLKDFPNVSFTEAQLMKTPEEEDTEKYIVKKILGEQVNEDGELYYLVWWDGFLKRDATYEPSRNIEKDAPQAVLDYKQNLKSNK